MRNLSLHFYSGKDIELVRTDFQHELIYTRRIAVRGKRAEVFRSDGTFQWTSAVKALSIFFICARLQPFLETASDLVEPLLWGGRGSPASSLDFALGKEPLWLEGMFGSDGRARLVIKRLIWRSNPELRRAGPVGLSLNSRLLESTDISITLDETPLVAEEPLIKLETQVRKQWFARGKRFTKNRQKREAA